MSRARLHIALGMLMMFSAGSTVLSRPEVWNFSAVLAGVAALVLAWLKARIILSRYLRLEDAPSWQRGFEISLGLFCLILLGLYLLPLGR